MAKYLIQISGNFQYLSHYENIQIIFKICSKNRKEYYGFIRNFSTKFKKKTIVRLEPKYNYLLKIDTQIKSTSANLLDDIKDRIHKGV